MLRRIMGVMESVTIEIAMNGGAVIQLETGWETAEYNEDKIFEW